MGLYSVTSFKIPSSKVRLITQPLFHEIMQRKFQVLEQRKHILTLTRWYRAKYITNSDSKSHANFLCTGLDRPSQYAS
jgi:hypothetical protein